MFTDEIATTSTTTDMCQVHQESGKADGKRPLDEPDAAEEQQQIKKAKSETCTQGSFKKGLERHEFLVSGKLDFLVETDAVRGYALFLRKDEKDVKVEEIKNLTLGLAGWAEYAHEHAHLKTVEWDHWRSLVHKLGGVEKAYPVLSNMIEIFGLVDTEKVSQIVLYHRKPDDQIVDEYMKHHLLQM